jgi:hypothetical protein
MDFRTLRIRVKVVVLRGGGGVHFVVFVRSDQVGFRFEFITSAALSKRTGCLDLTQN